MRGFIKACGGLFVIAGFVGFAIAVMAAITSFQEGLNGVAVGLTIVFAAAGVSLVGGTAYMLCSIDERLENIRNRRPRATLTGVGGPHSPEW